MNVREPKSTQPLVAADANVTLWAEARQRLAEADLYWLATVRPDGRPHVRPILAVWLEDMLCFCANTTTRKGRNLADNPYCAITAVNDNAHLVIEGQAAIARDEAQLQLVAEAYSSKYEWHVTVRDGAFYADGAPTAGPPPYHVYEVRPTVVFGFGADESISPTRWSF